MKISADERIASAAMALLCLGLTVLCVSAAFVCPPFIIPFIVMVSIGSLFPAYLWGRVAWTGKL